MRRRRFPGALSGSPAAGIAPGADPARALGRIEPGADGPTRFGPVRFGAACRTAAVLELRHSRPAQAAARREQRQRFQQVGLARPVGPGKHDGARRRLKPDAAPRPERGQLQPPHGEDRLRRQHIHSPLPLGEGVRGRGERRLRQHRRRHRRAGGQLLPFPLSQREGDWIGIPTNAGRLQRRRHFGEHAVGIRQHLVVPESQDGIAFVPEPAVASRIVCSLHLAMLVAIDFHDQPGRRAVEIDNVGTDRLLTPETRPQPHSAQLRPKTHFRVGHRLAEILRQSSLENTSSLRRRPVCGCHRPTPPPNPLPQGEGGTGWPLSFGRAGVKCPVRPASASGRRATPRPPGRGSRSASRCPPVRTSAPRPRSGSRYRAGSGR